jgi:ankyrin repeat protein
MTQESLNEMALCFELLQAVGRRDHEAIRRIVASGVSPDGRPLDDTIPLDIAIAMRDVGTVKLLIELGADVNVQRGNGWTPMKSAEVEGDRAVLKAMRKSIHSHSG